MGKSVLVTGAHGFIGRHVARFFSQAGYKVTGMGHGAWGQGEFSRFGLTFWHSADATLDALVTYANEPDVIIHCAGSGSVSFSMSHPYEDYMRTVSSTAAVLEYVRLYSPETSVIYPSSAAVYGQVEYLPIKEHDPMCPVSPYGVHKRMAEELCHSYATNFQISVAIVRLFSIYGEGLKKQLLWDACCKAENKESCFSGTGQELRDWLHVDDAAHLVHALVPYAATACPIFNGASGKGVTTAEVLSAVYEAYGSSLPLAFSGSSRPGDPIGYQADMSKTVALGWRPSIDLVSGIKRYVEWFREERS